MTPYPEALPSRKPIVPRPTSDQGIFLVYHSPGCFERLIREGKDINAKDKDGRTLLSYAAIHNNTTRVTQLLNHKDIDSETQDNNGRTPLSLAAEEGCTDIISLLLGADVNPNTKDNNDRTALSYAADTGKFDGVRVVDAVKKFDAVKLLVRARGIDPKIQSKDGRTPLLIAVKQGSKDIVQELANHTDYLDRTVLSWAAEHDHERAVELLLDIEYVDPSSKDLGGLTPLSRALQNGHKAAIKHLAYADPTALHTIIEGDYMDREELVLDSKANVNGRDSCQRTPLHIAILHKKTELVEKLIKMKAEINSEDIYGMTPLRLAVEQKDKVSIKLLLGKGAHTKGITIEKWFDAHDMKASNMRVAILEKPGNEKQINFMREPLEMLATPETTRYLFSVYPCPNGEAKSIVQQLFKGCPDMLKRLEPIIADPPMLNIIGGASKMNGDTLIYVGVSYPTSPDREYFRISWDLCVIAWTIIPPAKPNDGLNYKSVAHFSMLPNGWIPEDGHDFFQQFMIYLRKKWLDLCDTAEEHLTRQVCYPRLALILIISKYIYLILQRNKQLEKQGNDYEMVKTLAKDAQEWANLRRILQDEVRKARKFAADYFQQNDRNKNSKTNKSIESFSNEVGDRLRQLDQTVQDLLQFVSNTISHCNKSDYGTGILMDFNQRGS